MNAIEKIDNAQTLQDALRITGEVTLNRIEKGNAHHVRIEYIKAKRGPRAVGGFFEPTAKNVTAKFSQVWLAEHAN